MNEPSKLIGFPCKISTAQLYLVVDKVNTGKVGKTSFFFFFFYELHVCLNYDYECR